MNDILTTIAIFIIAICLIIINQESKGIRAMNKSQDEFNKKIIKRVEQQDVINKEQNSINADLIDTIGAMQQGGY